MTISEKNTYERVYTILQEHVGSNVELSPDTDLLQDLGMDSIEQVELGLKLEKTFVTKIAFANLRACVNIDDVVQLVKRTISHKV